MGAKPSDTVISDLFDDHYRALVATAYVMVRDRGLAEEIAQEAFVRLIDRWERLQHFETPQNWLRLVTVRLAGRYRLRRWREGLGAPGRESAAPSLPSGVGNAVTAAMAALSPLDRKAVALRYFADQSIQQIARELDMAESTVRVHLHRGRNGIKARLSPEIAEAWSRSSAAPLRADSATKE